MDIIALRGYSQSGKTKTMNKLRDILLHIGYTIDHHDVNNQQLLNNDFIAILNKPTWRIALISQGDYPHLVTEYLRDARADRCDLAICTCSIGRGRACGVVDAIKNSLKEGEELVFIGHTICEPRLQDKNTECKICTGEVGRISCKKDIYQNNSIILILELLKQFETRSI